MTLIKLLLTLTISLLAFSVIAEEKSVYFISPADGAELTSPVTIKFGLKGMGVAPAGVDVKNTGHHHLLINLDKLPDMTMSLPATENIKHFGGGQTETTLDLPKGTHTLQLLLGDLFTNLTQNQ